MTNTQLLALSIALVGSALIFGFTQQPQTINVGGAGPGLQAVVGSSTLTALAANTAQVVSATSTCSSRTVTTTQSAVMLTFNDKYTATGQFGTWQAASSSVTYDGEMRGCGAMKAFSFAAQNITVEIAQ